ncbi:MAG TPA: glycerophosphodiester phosphodiesterase family protein, partial [Vicinamibacterales bacterium]|nr:glycerophosphodiester phosphodiesterase family protein [Vicinamibacterales bacterium]
MSHRAIGAPAARPLVFAHRGGAALAPENTIAAFDRGLACGADGLELDVRLARDGVPVVIHDATLERTTDAVGPVAAYDAAALSRVDAAWWFAPERGYPLRGTGIGVPRLEDVIARYPDVPLLVELKDASPVLADRVVELLAAAGALGRAAVGSFALE